MCRETVYAIQLRGYHAADLRFCFRKMLKKVFSWHGPYDMVSMRTDNNTIL